MSTERNNLNEFTTRSGVALKLRPVSAHLLRLAQIPIEDDFRARGEAIDPPTYTSLPAAGGEIEELPLTETILDRFAGDPQETDVKAKWARHQAALARLEEAQAETALQAQLTLGIDFEVPEDDETKEWFTQIETVIRVPIPENKHDRKVFYLIHRPILSRLEIQEVTTQISMLSAGAEVDPQQVALFRTRAEDLMGREINDRLKLFTNSMEPVASKPEIPGAEDSEGVGDQAE